MRSFQNFGQRNIMLIGSGDLIFVLLAYQFSFLIRSQTKLYFFSDIIFLLYQKRRIFEPVSLSD